MMLTVSGRADFSLENYRRVSLNRDQVVLSDKARRVMLLARQTFAELLTRRSGPDDKIETAPGILGAIRAQDAATRGYLAESSFVSRDSFGMGNLPERVVRGAVFASLLDLVGAHWLPP
jgi:hypothetical protein